MIPLFSRREMRAFDERAIRACHVPSLVLMENAGRGIAEVVRERCAARAATARRVVVVCGVGNNGGDGFVAARHLVRCDVPVRCVLVGDAARLSPDARANHDAFVGFGGDVRSGASASAVRDALAGADLILDALMGTGLDRALEGLLADAVLAMNAAHAERVAVDIPSGLDADTGAPLGVAVVAHTTVTLGHYKKGLMTPSGARHAGRVVLADIGVPANFEGMTCDAEWLEERDVRAWLHPRPIDAHKHSVGHVAVFAGRPGTIGASLLVAEGALRSGAGAVTIATFAEAARALDSRVVEIMTRAIEPTADSIDAALAGKRVAVVGPGFGTGADSRAVVMHLLQKHQGPLVVDADALTLLAADAGVVARAARKIPAILTPHVGELARLLGVRADEIERDRYAAARLAAERTASIVVLKGPFTIVCDPSGRIVVNSTGNPALATAGSGDVLAGIVGAMAATLAPFEAACAGVYVHGAAGDAWMRAHTDRGLLASEIAAGVPDILALLLAPL